MKGYIGIDVGTTNVKAAVFRDDGSMEAYHSERTPIASTKQKWSEIDPYELWEIVKKCLKEVIRKCESLKMVSIGISSMGEAGTLVDGEGRALYPFITWYDRRAEKEYKLLEQAVGEDRLYNLTGQIPCVKYGISKLIWLKKHEKELYEKASHWLSVEDWIIFCLTGRYVTDYSIASRTLAFDIHRLEWSEEILSAAGIKKSLLPQVLPGGTKVGKVRDDIKKSLGTSDNMIVSTGGHDHACASVAVNIQEDGVVLDSMGTAEVSMIAVDTLILNRNTKENYYSIYPHCGKKLYRVLTSNQSCGVCIEWLLNTWGQVMQLEAEKNGVSKYVYIEKFTEDKSSGTDHVFFFPFLRGSVENAGLRGTFWGMEDGDGAGDYAKAVIEGICFELKKQIEGYHTSFSETKKIRVVGGLSKSDFIMQCKSRIQDCVIEVPACTEAACYGAALLGAAGAGIITLEVAADLYHADKKYLPLKMREYENKFLRYLEVRQGISELYRKYAGES